MGIHRTMVFLAGVFITSATMCSYAQYPDTVKIMTYNINAEGHGSGSYSDIAAVIKEINPTINGIQKVDSSNSRNSAYVLQYLGEQAVKSYTFAAAQTNFQGGSGSYGIGFLSDEPPLGVRRLKIPKGSASEDRAALEIKVSMAGEPVRVIVTHLDYASAANRTVQIQQILPWIDSGGAASDPVVIMADFNAQSTESSMKLFETAGFNYVKGENGIILDTAQKINHILFRPASRWKIVSVGNPAYSASNRYPLWAKMQLLNPVTAQRQLSATNHTPSVAQITSTERCMTISLAKAARVSCELFTISGRKTGTIFNEKALFAGDNDILLPAGLAKGTAVVVATINGIHITKNVVNP